MQESQFNSLGTIKVKTRLPAGLGSDGERPSKWVICKLTFLLQTVGCLLPAVWSEFNIHRHIYKLFTLTEVIVGFIILLHHMMRLLCDPSSTTRVFRTRASVGQVGTLAEQLLPKENQRTGREWDHSLLGPVFLNPTDSWVWHVFAETPWLTQCSYKDRHILAAYGNSEIYLWEQRS